MQHYCAALVPMCKLSVKSFSKLFEFGWNARGVDRCGISFKFGEEADARKSPGISELPPATFR